jgi:hypothetical protein
MPKFYGQNKKRIDPRYFLAETSLRSRHQYDSYGYAGASGLDEDEDTEELARKLMAVINTPTNHCQENPDDEDCFSSDFLANLLKNRNAPGFDWPEEIENEEELALYLCGSEGRNSEWNWVASEAVQQYFQLQEEGKV